MSTAIRRSPGQAGTCGNDPSLIYSTSMPKIRTLRQTIFTGLIAFIVGFFAGLLTWGWLIARVYPGHQWWNISHMGFEHMVGSIFGGLCFAVVSIKSLNRTRHRR